MPLSLLLLFLLSLLSVSAGKGHKVSTATNTSHTCASPSLYGPQGPPGPPGRDGRDGRDGKDGRDCCSVGQANGVGLEEIREIVRLMAQEELYNLTQQIQARDPVKVIAECDSKQTSMTLMPTKTTPSPVSPTPLPTSSPPDTSVCPGTTVSNPSTSCRAILDCNPSAPSGYYWLLTIVPLKNRSSINHVYCYMEADKCGVRGVMRVAHIDMRNPSVNCPAPLTQYQLDSGERLCGSTKTARMTCDSVVFPTHHFSYKHVCGRAVGFSYYRPCAFHFYKNGGQTTINHAYVSGLSITYWCEGERTHIWTYVGGYSDKRSDSCNCPCAASPGASAPPFVGQDFYCESATRYTPPYPPRWYTNNTLWDGEDCYPGSSCCNNGFAPWFRRTLQEKTTGNIEVRWCTGQGLPNDRVATELLEIYIY